MLKIFLVEDEIVMREGIKGNIDWAGNGFEFAGEASDGELAYPMIRNIRPDIVITDIRMPFMDGLELSRLIRKEFPQIRIIILSGYDEFEYAQEAISIGVTDYLLKPISGKKLLEAVEKVAEAIKDENRQLDDIETYRKEQEENRTLEKRELFRLLVDGRASMTELLEKGKKLEVDLTASFYSCVLFQIETKESDNAITETYSETLVKITEQIREKIGNESDIQLYEQMGGVFVFLLLGENRDYIEKRRSDLLDFLKNLLSGHPDVIYFAGTGTVVERIREVGKSYAEANRAFAHRFLYEESRIFYAGDAEKNGLTGGKGDKSRKEEDSINISELDIGKLDRKITMNFLRSGSVSDIDHFAEDFLENVGRGNIGSLMFRQYVLMDLYFTAVSFLESLGLSAEEVTETLGVFDGRSDADIREYMKKLFTKAIDKRNQISESRYNRVIEDARNYIFDNYANEDISLNMVASHVNISPNHFSGVFRQETGETFIEFLTRVRMEKARELLRSTSLKLSEVGFQVGYKDPHYFSYIFKKTQNMTPRQFRDKGEQ